MRYARPAATLFFCLLGSSSFAADDDRSTLVAGFPSLCSVPFGRNLATRLGPSLATSGIARPRACRVFRAIPVMWRRLSGPNRRWTGLEIQRSLCRVII